MNTEDSEFQRIEREQAMRGVPDAIHHTDTRESLEYITGWNDCRQAMLVKQPVQQQNPFGDGAERYARKLREDRKAYKAIFTASTPQPAQRTWVGLTEQEAAGCWSTSAVCTWQAIETKLKEKNT